MGWFHRERSDSETSDVEIPTGGGRRPTPPHGGPSDLTSTTLSDADESKRQSRGSYSRRKYGSSTASLDDIDVDAGARTMDTTTMYASRILLSALAIALLWGSSLTAITQMLRVTDAIPIPPITTVFKEVFILMNTTRDVRQNYIDCIQDDLSICNATLIAARETEAERSATARRANVATRTRAQTVQASCSQAQALAMASIAAWQRAQSSGSTITSHYRSDCALSDREQLETMTGDTTAQRSATMRHVSGYTRNSNSRVRTLAEQIAARNRYDREYLYNKTLRNVEVDARLGQIGFNFSLSIDARFRGLNISAIRACATMLGGDCPDGQGARDMVNAMRQNLVNQYEMAQRSYQTTADTAARYRDRAEARMQQVADTFSQIRSTLNTQFPEIGGFSGVFPGVSFPSTSLTPPSFNPTLPDLNIPVDQTVDEIARRTAAAADNFDRQLDSAINFANLDGSLMQDQLGGLNMCADPPPTGQVSSQLCFDDYNPPPCCASQQEMADQHDRETQQFEEDVALSIDALDQANRQRNGSDDGFSPIFSTNASASDLIRGLRDTSWLNYQYLTDAGLLDDFQWILTPLRVVGNIMQILDTVWRIFQTIRIIRRFWGRSALSVSQIDVTTDTESRSRAGRLFNPLQGCALILTHPIVLMGVLLGFLFIIGGTAFTLYQPIFGAYRSGCLDRDSAGQLIGDGTFLTQNVYALSFNYASNDGNRIRLNGLDAYDTNRGEVCARYGEKSANDEQRVQAEMDVIVGAHTRTQADVALMNRCYDLDMLDASFQATPVRDTDNNIYPSPKATLLEPTCNEHLSNETLEEGIFDCTALPECLITCDDLSDGPMRIDRTPLFDYSRASMCTAQWWFHSTVLRLVFTVVIWVFVNLFRVVFTAGVLRLCWQFLNTGYFTYMATCRADGSHTYKEEDLADKVQAMLYRMRLYGLFLVSFAVSTQVPWIVAIYYFSSGGIALTIAR